MTIIGWIVFGLIAGFVASKIVDKHGQGIVMNVVLGIAGAVVGGMLFSAFGARGVTGFDLFSLLVATTGAAIVLVAYHAILGRRERRA